MPDYTKAVGIDTGLPKSDIEALLKVNIKDLIDSKVSKVAGKQRLIRRQIARLLTRLNASR